ncbi:MAG: hypothetical protein JXA60_01980 [Candidatus Coatesbacteria bacterium]|nr:hypothetical protein [Candidatus Coatesbacteria bacterium]
MKYCDIFCEHAEFPSKDALDGACRREVSLYCKLLERLVLKNSPCKAGINEESDK